MKLSINIGVKFCGNCNPHINTVKLLDDVKNYYNDIRFVKWDEEDYDLLIILNSCPVGCATHPKFSGNKIIINNDSINCKPFSNEELFNEIIKIINMLKFK